MKNSESIAMIKKHLDYLHHDGKTFELCLMKPQVKKSELWQNDQVFGSGIVAGWYDDKETAARMAAKLNRVAPEGIYVSLNPCKKILKARANNRLKANVNRTKDNDILKLKNILIDVDPVRPSGVSSTDKEHELAKDTALAIRRDLMKKGFPRPLVGDSGNGYHLIFKTNLDNNEQNVRLINGFLCSLAQKYDTDEVKVDTGVSNPGRIVKLLGTRARKGEDIKGRPHRKSRIFKMPKKTKEVKTRHLLKIASSIVHTAPHDTGPIARRASFMDVPAYAKHYGVEISKPKSYRGGKLYRIKKCLFNPSHTPNKASIIQSSDGMLYYRCLHDSCRDKTWHDARQATSGGDKLDQFYPELKGGEPEEEIRYSLMNGAELINERVKERLIINDLLEQGGSLLIVGPTGIMKSMLTLNMGLNLAHPPEDGLLWHLFRIPKTINTLYVQSENSIYGTNKRITLMVAGNAGFKDALRKIHFPTRRRDCRITGDLRDEHFQNQLKEMIFKTKARLVVIDPLISFHNQNENDNAELRKVLDALTKVCEVTKAACLLVHHTGKTSKEGSFAGRGASSIADWASNILVLSEGKENPDNGNKRIKVHHVKGRNFVTRPPFTLEVSGTLQFDKVDTSAEKNLDLVLEVLTSLGGEVEDQGTFKKELVDKGFSSDATAGRAIEIAVTAGTITAFKNGKKKGYRLPPPEEDE